MGQLNTSTFEASGVLVVPDTHLLGLSNASSMKAHKLPIVRVARGRGSEPHAINGSIRVEPYPGLKFALWPEEMLIEYWRGGSDDIIFSHALGDHALPLLWSFLPGSVLHGALLSSGPWAVGVLGVSGAGKSTTTAAWIAAGRSFSGDDWFRVELRCGRAVAIPSHPALRLSPESAILAGFDIEGAPATPAIRQRLWWTFPEDGPHFCAETRAVAAIVSIERVERAAPFSVARLKPGQALIAMLASLRVPLEPIPLLWRKQLVVLQSLADGTPVLRAFVPEGAGGLSTLVSFLAQLTGQVGDALGISGTSVAEESGQAPPAVDAVALGAMDR
ncbi:MAG: hypothetical protein HY900_30260 [Deltaproteobacteria bacterium]|nr:hypothetical protein [Deltaproteobacteria bacterium]